MELTDKPEYLHEHWSRLMDEREMKLVQHAVDYANIYPDAGVPGQAYFLLVAKMVVMLNSFEDSITHAQGKTVKQQLVWSEKDRCWRDVLTGVRVEIEDRYSKSYDTDTINR